jgi:hypothetical protein
VSAAVFAAFDKDDILCHLVKGKGTYFGAFFNNHHIDFQKLYIGSTIFCVI